MPGGDVEATRIDSDKINDIIINGGIARQAAPHRSIFNASSQTWRQYVREEKVPLRTTLDPDSARFRSQFNYKPVTKDIPWIVDGLSYGRFKMARVDAGILPVDQQQRDLASFFMQAEDRLFFAGDPTTPAGGATGFANEGEVIGTNFTVNAATELDLTTDITMTTTLAGMIGQQKDHFKTAMNEYSLVMAVTPDVDDRIMEYKNAVTGERMRNSMLAMLAENGNGSAAILRTDWLGAAVDIGNGNLPYKVTAGTLGAALMMWSNTNPLYEVLESGILVDSGVDELGNFNANLSNAYLPVSYDPFSIINSATVDVTA